MNQRPELTDVEWRRVSPKLIVAELLMTVASWLIVVAATYFAHLWDWSIAWPLTAAAITLLLLTAAFTPRRVRAYGYQLRQDDLVFRRGIMFTRIVAVPYGRMQLVDISRGPLSRMLGLSELKLVTAAATTGVTIPGLTEADAEALRDHLVEVAESRRAGL